MCGGYWMWKAHETIPKRNDQLEVCLDGGRKPERTSVKPRFLLLGGGSCSSAVLGNSAALIAGPEMMLRWAETAETQRLRPLATRPLGLPPSRPPGTAAYSGCADCGAAVMRSGTCTPWSAWTCTRAPIMAGGPFAVTSRKTSEGAGDCRWSVHQARLRKSWNPNYKLSRIELKIYNFEECEFTRTSQQWSAAAVSTVPVRIPWEGSGGAFVCGVCMFSRALWLPLPGHAFQASLNRLIRIAVSCSCFCAGPVAHGPKGQKTDDIITSFYQDKITILPVHSRGLTLHISL